MREEDGLEAAAVEVPAAAAAAARQVCWNTKCGSSGSSKWRPGWVLRAGNTAYLCDSCGYGDLLACFSPLPMRLTFLSVCLQRKRVDTWVFGDLMTPFLSFLFSIWVLL
jgi:hypothetical protein